MGKRDFADTVVVITGASSGFGRGVALELADAGARVVLAARREQALDELASECQARGGQALPVPTDVSRQSDVEKLAQAAISTFGSVDVWINDAGVAALGRFEDVPLADHLQVILTNLVGVINGSWYAVRHFRERRRGTLINIASALGKMPAPYYGSYVASKFGIVGLDGVLRQELALAKLKNVKVCTVMPMSHDTPIFDHMGNYTGHEVQPIPPLYDEHNVIKAVMRLIKHPKNEIIVGRVGKLLKAARGLLRNPVDRMMARNSHRALIKKSPPASDRRGNVFEPMRYGAAVSGGRRRRSRRRVKA
jgi:short-subunit dehydrogenase